MNPHDSICAPATPLGVGKLAGGRCVIRTAGPLAWSAAETLLEASSNRDASDLAKIPVGTTAGHLQVQNERIPAVLWAFRGPRSATGDDVIEYHLPANAIVAGWVVQALLAIGFRLAEPGEFTVRALLNGRMDLTAAEGVAAVIAAGSDRQLAAARSLLIGELARQITPAVDELASLLALVEVGIDFTDQDVVAISPADRVARVDAMHDRLEHLLRTADRHEAIVGRPKVVLAGRPNAGKSTLLNRLAGELRTVVSDQAGTTRDVITAPVKLARGWVDVTDIAGLERDDFTARASVESFENEPPDRSAADSIALQMQQHAARAIESADVLVLVQPAFDDDAAPQLPRRPDVVVRSQLDRAPAPPPLHKHSTMATTIAKDALALQLNVSAVTGQGIDTLLAALDCLCFGQEADEFSSAITLNARHEHELRLATTHLRSARQDIGDELVAAELRAALDALGRITGVVSADDVLGKIFSGFCIGK